MFSRYENLLAKYKKAVAGILIMNHPCVIYRVDELMRKFSIFHGNSKSSSVLLHSSFQYEKHKTFRMSKTMCRVQQKNKRFTSLILKMKQCELNLVWNLSGRALQIIKSMHNVDSILMVCINLSMMTMKFRGFKLNYLFTMRYFKYEL